MKLLNILIVIMTFIYFPPHKASPRVFGPTLICQLGLPPSLTLVQLGGRRGNKQGCQRASDSRQFPWGLWGGGEMLIVVCIWVMTPETETIVHIHNHNIPHRACPSVQLGTPREARDPLSPVLRKGENDHSV